MISGHGNIQGCKISDPTIFMSQTNKAHICQWQCWKSLEHWLYVVIDWWAMKKNYTFCQRHGWYFLKFFGVKTVAAILASNAAELNRLHYFLLLVNFIPELSPTIVPYENNIREGKWIESKNNENGVWNLFNSRELSCHKNQKIV